MAASSQREAEELSTRRFSISSEVIPGVLVALDSVALLSTGAISYFVIVADQVEAPGHYAAAIGFVWVASLMLMNFAGLYQFEPIMRPLAFLDKIVIAFITTFLFLL